MTGAAWSVSVPFSGVEIHMEMDMEWKWMEMGQNYFDMDWVDVPLLFGFGVEWIWIQLCGVGWNRAENLPHEDL